MTTTRKKLFVVAGARPSFIKVATILRELRKHNDTFEYKLIHAGQHYDKEMSDLFFCNWRSRVRIVSWKLGVLACVSNRHRMLRAPGICSLYCRQPFHGNVAAARTQQDE